jgi:Concanavalin A-like lectin/glucanases superfamily/GDSL-like Lipase/Acylhydrolase family/SdrD B-like domain/CarboxypepD_reg-like domain
MVPKNYTPYRVMCSLLIIALNLLIAGNGSAQDQISGCPSNMIHYWRLDENDSPYADSYGTNNAACTNCPIATAGIINGAQQFDATTDVSADDDNTFDWGNAESFSIELWMKPDSGNTCPDTQVMVGRDDNNTPLHWWIGCTDGKAEAYLSDTGGVGSGVKGTKNISDGNWHHVVLIRDAGANETLIYVDGVKDGSVTKTYTSKFESTAPLNIGWINLNDGYHFLGTLDEIALYSRALTGAEVRQHYYDGSIGLRWGNCGCSSKVRIMPLGDSITAGDYGDVRPFDGLYGYRRTLYRSLEDNGYDIDFVGSLHYGSATFPPVWDIDHEGHLGWQIAEISDKIDNFLNANPVDIILLHIGTNDVSHDIQSADAVSGLIDHVFSFNKGITVILALIISRTDGLSQRTALFNDDVEAMAEKRIAKGDKIIVVDMEHALSYPADLSDHIHPNDTGYTKMANVWLNALKNFVPMCSVGTYSISGTVSTQNSIKGLPNTPMAGVTMTLSGAANGTTTTNVNGNYTFTGLTRGNYTISPGKAWYTFTPASRSVTINGANTQGQNFSGVFTGQTKYSISGVVTSGGSGLSGVTMTLSGSAIGTTPTDSNGNYSFTGLSNGIYTIRPSKAGYTFTPASISVTINGANTQGQNFSGVFTGQTKYSISGVVTSGGSGLSGVTMTLSGSAIGTTPTDSNGNYSFTGLSNGIYTIRPSKAGYTFTPASISVTINGTTVAGQNFTGTGTSMGGGTFSASGTVRTPSIIKGMPGTPMAGVRMTLSGAANGTTITDVNGNYTFRELADGNYTITPSKTWYTFTPANRSVTINGANTQGQNFSGVFTGQ